MTTVFLILCMIKKKRRKNYKKKNLGEHYKKKILLVALFSEAAILRMAELISSLLALSVFCGDQYFFCKVIMYTYIYL